MLHSVLEITEKAGLLALSFFRRVSASVKADGSLVTEADRAVERFLREEVLRRFPSSSFLGEEGDDVRGGSLLWVVDPIDGTGMFSVGGRTWCVAVAVFDGAEPLAAAVYDPCGGEMFHARGGRMYVNNVPAPARPFAPGPESVLYAPSNFHRDYSVRDYAGKVRNLGSGCLHIAYAAAGRGDASVLRGHPWDVAPGFAFAAAAGWTPRTLDGSPAGWDYVMRHSPARTPSPLLFAPDERAASFFLDRLSFRPGGSP